MINDTEMVILVDTDDNQIGLAEKMQAHEAGLLHRAFSVFIIRLNNNNKYEILMQQRNINKYHCGGLWTNTCCSHPRDQEGVVQAAQRRLQEEMGLQIALQEIGEFTYRAAFGNGLVEHEYDHVLLGFYNDESFAVNASEVQDYRWMTFDELQQDLAIEPDLYTPWLKPALNIVRQHMELI